MKLWLFTMKKKPRWEEVAQVVIRSSTAVSAGRILERELLVSADDYDVVELRQTGKAEVVCVDTVSA